MNLYFRIRDHGASVYRLDVENRNRRLEMHQVANVNVRSGEIREAAGMVLSAEERAEIGRWVERRRATLAARDAGAAERLVEHLNEVAQWLQARATDAEVEAVAESLLLAMHDLRATIVRRKADMLREG